MDKPLPEMTASVSDDQLSAFLKSGIYRFNDANAFFINPVRVLNRSYTRFRVSASTYYTRFFPSLNLPPGNHSNAPNNSNKRKRREKEKKKAQTLNWREQMADRRHQEVRLALLKAHETLLGASQLLETLRDLRNDGEKCNVESISQGTELNFVELWSVWQAPCYEIVLKHHEDDTTLENAVFDNHIANEGSDDIEAELLDHKYRTLPNRYFLSLPIKQLTHSDGALVALWVTNREKLRNFVENELFPKWGVKHAATLYWLKVNADGFLISELDLFHHRPYECLLLGFSHGKLFYGLLDATIADFLERDDFREFIIRTSDTDKVEQSDELRADHLVGRPKTLTTAPKSHRSEPFTRSAGNCSGSAYAGALSCSLCPCYTRWMSRLMGRRGSVKSKEWRAVEMERVFWR
ncbi:methyltransferase-like protein 2 [Phtheirospermum japonicum]|uniref:Methyltransferase-like protein 2 n=1 Tax=Phtheirospermum japonicum TaxID=374723 RepID=A0A830D892_9LAMI|nr:methyltransferase-like protein 2 [Phtheirospermum japonicum]